MEKLIVMNSTGQNMTTDRIERNVLATSTSNVVGRQFFLDFNGCDIQVLSSTSFIRKAMLHAAQASGATVVTDVFHQFNPFGVSGVVVIAESHIAIHTWPEHGYAAVDVFTCGAKIDITKIRSVLADALVSEDVSERAFTRGFRT